MTSFAAAGDSVVDVERIPLRDVKSAWERQAGSMHHELVLAPGAVGGARSARPIKVRGAVSASRGEASAVDVRKR